MSANDVLVGTDGSAGSFAAVRWAAREAHRRAAALRIVHAYDPDTALTASPPARRFAYEHFTDVRIPDERYPDRRFPDAHCLDLGRNNADAALDEAVAHAREVAPAITVYRVPLTGDPVPAILEATAGAGLLVVGHRGRSGLASLLLGSTSQRLATHAPVPVVVVRGRPDAVEGPIVVGADGSPSSTAALGAAFDLAQDRGGTLIAVRAHTRASVRVGAPREREIEEYEALRAQLAPRRSKYPGVRVEPVVAECAPTDALTRLSGRAQLVVVGSRGHNALTGTLLGSVGLHLLHHADCPVFIARGVAPAGVQAAHSDRSGTRRLAQGGTPGGGQP